jgi:hypothetical protein
LRSDAHHDNPHNNRELEKKHLDEALEKDAGIIDGGDLFCAMQGAWDPRKSKSCLRPEHQRSDYLDAIVTTAADFYQPYAKNIVCLGQGNHECHDADTEILTRRGWVLFKDLLASDEVGTMRLSDGQFEWQLPTDYHQSRHVGDMILAEGKTYNFCVTPGHDIVYKSKHGLSWKKVSADTFANMAHRAVQIPVAAHLDNEDCPLSDDEITFAGILLTDGSIQERLGRTTQVLLFQAEDKAKYVRDLLNRLGFEYTERQSNPVTGIVDRPSGPYTIYGQKQMFRWYIKGQSRLRALEILPTKKQMPTWVDLMSARQARVFFKAIVFGDGTTNAQSVTSHRIFGTRDSLERMQHLALKHGFRTSLREYREDEWLLNICDFDFTTVQQPIKYLRYNGLVYCCTVPNGTLITRRNGKVLVSGNSSILKRHESNLTERLAQALRDRTGALVPVTGYTGWLKFQFMVSNRVQTARTLWHCHGYGGGGPVTVDNIQAQRQNAYVEGADIMFSGHTHDRWAREFCKVGLTQDGEVFQRNLWYVKSASYKNEYNEGGGGWHVETGKPPKPLGAWWLKMTYYREKVKGTRHSRVLTELIPAN